MKKKQPNNEDAQYIPERRTVQILNILKQISDEAHPVKQSKILEEMRNTGEATTENAGTLSKSIDEILIQINPDRYSKEEEDNYRIKYKGYEEDCIRIKQELKYNKKNGANNAKAPYITNLYYVHDLSYDDLDKVIQAVSFSSAIAPSDKERLIRKLVKISSKYYSSPYYNRDKEKLTFNPMGIYSRVSCKDMSGSEQLATNLSIIQDAINRMQQITFDFNGYDANGKLYDGEPHTLSPYYIVVYHDMYYLIGGKRGKNRASHYRIDLMTNVLMAVDDSGKNIKIEPMSHFENLPKREQWNPEKYMSQHLYMSYDDPRAIKIKIRKDKYTVLHDWFGNHYKKCEEGCEDGYDVAEVVSSPNMIVHWAMQYAGVVEIMDEEIRDKIREEIRLMEKKYGKSN